MLSPLKSLLAQFFVPEGNPSPVIQPRYLQLATAVLLVEVMQSDTRVTDAERHATLTALRRLFDLDDHTLAQLVAQAQATAKAANDYFAFTSAMNDEFSQPEKIQLVEYLWQVAYADGHLDANENHVISKVAGLLHVTHGEYIAAKLHAKQAANVHT